MANLQKFKYLLKNLVIKHKVCKKLRELQQIIHFWKALDPANSIPAKFVKPECALKKNWKCSNFLERPLCKISLQTLCNLLAFLIGFQRAIIC